MCPLPLEIIVTTRIKAETCSTCGKRRVLCQQCKRCNGCGHHPSCNNRVWATDADRYEIRNDLAARQPYARNGNVGRQKLAVNYTVWDKETNRPVSSPLPRLKDAKAFILELLQANQGKPLIEIL